MANMDEVDVELREMASKMQPRVFTDQTMVSAREDFLKMFSMPTIESVEITPLKVPGPQGAPEVELFTYIAKTKPNTRVPAFFWIHGGGHISGDALMDHKRMAKIAKELNIVVISTNYRLAPENPFPAGIEDVYASLKWVHVNADKLGIDVNKIALGGASAGGGKAAGLAQMVRDRGEFKFVFQILLYPMVDDRTALKENNKEYFVWSPASNKYAWKSYLGSTQVGSEEVSPYAAPLRAKSLVGVPPAYIPVGELDLFKEEAVEYAKKLWEAGISAELHVIPKVFHGFDLIEDAYESKRLDAHIKYILKRELLTK